MAFLSGPLLEEYVQWRFIEEQEARFTAKTCLIAAQGEQQENIEHENGLEASANDVEDDMNDGLMIVDSGLPSLKRKFLDRLAEIFARKKLASFVSATAMEEFEDKVIIHIVRNEVFAEKDQQFWRTFKHCLESMAAKDSSSDSWKSLLWDKLLSFYRERLLIHLSDLCNYINKTLRSISTHDIAAAGFKDGDLNKLVHLCRDHNERTSSDSELGLIAEMSYSVARSYTKSPARLDCSKGELDGSKILRLMRLVGRIRTCYYTFLEVAFRFPSFQEVDLVCTAPSTLESRVPKSLRIPFPEDLKKFHGASDESVKKSAKIIARYNALCAKRLHVHAEIGLLFHLLEKGSNLSRVFPYIGISKRSCFLCHHMLLGVDVFENRGCHGVLETQWTLPRSFELSSNYGERVFVSFLKLQKLVTERSRTLKTTRINRRPQSEGLVSDWISMKDKLEVAARMEANARTRENQEEALFWESQDDSSLVSRKLSREVSAPALFVYPSRHCHNCKRQRDLIARFMICTGCHQVRYCSRACQRVHWLSHKFNCKGYRLKSADILVYDCWQEEFPEDDDVLEDFGITKFFEAFDRQSLFVLYKDMVTSEGITSCSLDKWLVRGCLREGIIHCYTRQSVSKLFQWQIEGSLQEHVLDSYLSTGKSWNPECGDCFEWFLKNLETLSLETPNWNWEMKVDNWHATKLPLLLDAEDRDIPFNELQPESKREAVQFWMETDFSIPPFPGEDNWVTFGFCTGHTKGEQAQLISLYQKLLQKCSFKEFSNARRHSTMIALFDKYGFGNERKSFRHFQSVMDNNKALPSAWYLKSFVYDTMATDLPSSLRAVAIDYGFNHCRNAADRTRLKQAYREVFDKKADELLLHEACLSNRILEFCSPFIPTWTFADRDYFEALMENPYPMIPPRTWAGLVAKNVALCKESDEEVVRQKLTDEGRDDDVVLFVIPDDHEEGIRRLMADTNSYRLGESLQRYDGQDIVEARLSPEESRKALLQISVDRETGQGRKVLLLGSSGTE